MNRPLNRQEAVLYGQIVEACYTMYGRDHTILQPEPAAGDIPEPYELVAWVNMSDFILGDEMPKFYGIVVRHKVQKHSFILAIRGTEGLVEWLDDAFVHLVPFRPVPNAGRVSFGFDKIYSTLQVLRRHRGPRRNVCSQSGERAGLRARTDDGHVRAPAGTVDRSAGRTRAGSTGRADCEISEVIRRHRAQPGRVVVDALCNGEQGAEHDQHFNQLYLRLAAHRQQGVCAHVRSAPARFMAHRQHAGPRPQAADSNSGFSGLRSRRNRVPVLISRNG